MQLQGVAKDPMSDVRCPIQFSLAFLNTFSAFHRSACCINQGNGLRPLDTNRVEKEKRNRTSDIGHRTLTSEDRLVLLWTFCDTLKLHAGCRDTEGSRIFGFC
jgi:hypothetical protein